MRLAKKTSNLFRARAKTNAPGLDVSGLSGVISVDPAALPEHCRNQMPRYVVPRRIEVAAAFPRPGSGKIDRTSVVAGASSGALGVGVGAAVTATGSRRRRSAISPPMMPSAAVTSVVR